MARPEVDPRRATGAAGRGAARSRKSPRPVLDDDGKTSYGIHGSNNEWSIGREATHGCIRLYNDQIEKLWRRTKPGTPLRLIYQTVKVGRREQTIFVEAHPDVYGRDPEREVAAVEKLRSLDLWQFVDEPAFRRAIAETRGIPVPVGTLPPIESPLLVN